MTLRIRLGRIAEALGSQAPDNPSLPVRLPVETRAWVGRGPTHPIRLLGDGETSAPPPALWLVSAADAAPTDGSPYLVTRLDDAAVSYRISRLVDSMLPVTIPATLVSVRGVGVLLRGAAGAGKSETALALLDRGHHLIADDAVSLLARDTATLEGQAENAGRGVLVVRGLGVIDIDHHFPGQRRGNATIDLVVDIHVEATCSPLSGSWRRTGVLGRSFDAITLSPNRQLALLVETAVREGQYRRRGYNSLEGLACKQREHLE